MSPFTSLPDLLSLVQAARELSRELPLAELQRTLLGLLQARAGASYGALLDVREGGSWVILCQSEGEHRAPAELPSSVLESVHRTFKPVVIPDADSHTSQASAEAVRERGPHSVLCWPLTHHGRWHGLLYLERPLSTGAFDEASQGLVELLAIQAALALDNDRLSRAKSEQTGELQATWQQLQDIVDNSPDIIFLKDRESHYHLINNQFVKFFGRPRSEIVGRTDWELIPAEEVRKFRGNDLQVFDTGATLYFEEFLSDPLTHEPVTFFTAKFPLRGKDGKIQFLCGVARDITERKRAELALHRAHAELEQRVAERTEQLRSAQRELVDRAWHAGMAEIASGILHNLGNVLNGITVSSALVREGIQGMPLNLVGQVASLLDRPPEALATFLTQDERGRHAPEFLSKLHHKLAETQQSLLKESVILAEKIDHASHVVATQQTYAKNLVAMREKLRLRELAEDALRLCAIGGSDWTIQRDYGEEEPEFYERHITVQILVNLISNARNAVREQPGNPQPRITVSIRQGAHETCAAVSDNGMGFDEAVKARLFTYGFSTRPKGHGFGLHSARVSAQFLGGRVEAHSEGPGKGARFELILPRGAAKAAEERQGSG